MPRRHLQTPARVQVAVNTCSQHPCRHCALDQLVARCAPDGASAPPSDACATTSEGRACTVNFNADGTLWACVPPSQLLITCSATAACAGAVLREVQGAWGTSAGALVPAAAVRVHVGAAQVWETLPGGSVESASALVCASCMVPDCGVLIRGVVCTLAG